MDRERVAYPKRQVMSKVIYKALIPRYYALSCPVPVLDNHSAGKAALVLGGESCPT